MLSLVDSLAGPRLCSTKYGVREPYRPAWLATALENLRRRESSTRASVDRREREQAAPLLRADLAMMGSVGFVEGSRGACRIISARCNLVDNHAAFHASITRGLGCSASQIPEVVAADVSGFCSRQLFARCSVRRHVHFPSPAGLRDGDRESDAARSGMSRGIRVRAAYTRSPAPGAVVDLRPEHRHPRCVGGEPGPVLLCECERRFAAGGSAQSRDSRSRAEHSRRITRCDQRTLYFVTAHLLTI